jgi:hypothetical protein
MAFDFALTAKAASLPDDLRCIWILPYWHLCRHKLGSRSTCRHSLRISIAFWLLEYDQATTLATNTKPKSQVWLDSLVGSASFRVSVGGGGDLQ